MPADRSFEAARLRALHRSGLLEAHSQIQFDRITELVRDMLDVPMSVASIVSNDRQVFVGHCGLPPSWSERGETPLTHSFCKHVVERDAPMIVRDALADPTVRDNPAIADVGVVAYLGVPLHLPSGEVAGALAAIDQAPREWSADDLRRLERLAQIATNEIAVRVSEVKWRTLFEDMQEGFYIGEAIRDDADAMSDFRFVDINPAFERLTGIPAQETIGRTLYEAIPDIGPELLAIYARVLETDRHEVFEIDLPMLANRWFEGRVRPLGGDRFAVVFTNISERKREQIRLAELDERRRMATEVGEVGLWDLDIDAATLVLDDRMRMMNGVFDDRVLDMKGAFDAIHPEDRARVERELQGLADGVEDSLQTQYRVIGIEDGVPRTVLINGRPMRDHDGRTVRLIGAARDVTDRIAGDQRRTLLNQELAHRLKNTLAVVSSIVTQTLRSSPDLESARVALSARIQALAKAHDILLSGHRDAANVAAVVAAAVALHDEGRRIELDGPPLPLGPKASMTLALIVHELSTNSGKYGALSTPKGVVNVEWRVSRSPETDGPVMTFVWEERDGPAVVAPTRKGFGTRLVEMGLSGTSGGSSHIEYAPEGLRCRIVAPLVELLTEEEEETV